jgi:xanthosine utilization system XapX-like protein
MMVKTEGAHEDGPARLSPAALSVLLGIIAACFSFNDLLAWNALRAWQPLGVLALNLLMVGAIWGLLKLKPSKPKAVALLYLLGIVAFAGFAASASVVKVLVATQTLSGPWPGQTVWVFASNLLIGVGAIWGLSRLKPWKELKGSDELLSPSTRKAKTLLGLSGLICAASFVALYSGAFSKAHPAAFFSSSPVPLWIGIVAIVGWLLGQAINKWWWYFSADEHQRKADDVGNLAGWALFFVVTPAWWVAARAGLLPQPNAMLLWVIAVGVSATGYYWRRYR